jgi:transposase
MGLSRRQFTKEFKLAAVRRLEQNVSIAEAARALEEVSANVLHQWRHEFRQGPGNAFPGNGKERWSEEVWPNWSGKSLVSYRKWRGGEQLCSR